MKKVVIAGLLTVMAATGAMAQYQGKPAGEHCPEGTLCATHVMVNR